MLASGGGDAPPTSLTLSRLGVLRLADGRVLVSDCSLGANTSAFIGETKATGTPFSVESLAHMLFMVPPKYNAARRGNNVNNRGRNNHRRDKESDASTSNGLDYDDQEAGKTEQQAPAPAHTASLVHLLRKSREDRCRLQARVDELEAALAAARSRGSTIENDERQTADKNNNNKSSDNDRARNDGDSDSYLVTDKLEETRDTTGAAATYDESANAVVVDDSAQLRELLRVLRVENETLKSKLLDSAEAAAAS